MQKVNITNLPSTAFMAAGLSSNSDVFNQYAYKYNQPLMATEVGRNMLMESRMVFNHAIGDDVLRKAKDMFLTDTSSVSSDQIYTLLPGTYESANVRMKDLVMYNPDMYKLYQQDEINAYQGYEYKIKSIDIEDIQDHILSNIVSSDSVDDDDMYIMMETSDPDDYEVFTEAEKDIVRDLWHMTSTSIQEEIDPVNGESL